MSIEFSNNVLMQLINKYGSWLTKWNSHNLGIEQSGKEHEPTVQQIITIQKNR